MLSSESAASGTNLTAASTVILLDPVYGTYEYRRNTEWQAIGRAYRMGQTKKVTVVRFLNLLIISLNPALVIFVPDKQSVCRCFNEDNAPRPLVLTSVKLISNLRRFSNMLTLVRSSFFTGSLARLNDMT